MQIRTLREQKLPKGSIYLDYRLRRIQTVSTSRDLREEKYFSLHLIDLVDICTFKIIITHIYIHIHTLVLTHVRFKTNKHKRRYIFSMKSAFPLEIINWLYISKLPKLFDRVCVGASVTYEETDFAFISIYIYLHFRCSS